MKNTDREIVESDCAESMLVQVLMAVYEDFKDLERRLAKHLSSETGSRDGGASSIDKASLDRS